MSEIQENQVYCMDALEFLKKLPDNYADLILTDPPYGIGADKGKKQWGSAIGMGRDYDDEWDNKTPNKEIFDEILRVAKKVIIFGGNFFTDKLPVGTHWIWWDKKGNINFKNTLGDGELAWTNLARYGQKKYTIIQQGLIAEEKARLHPTQKPVALFQEIIEDYSKEEELIIDPFIGSGTTAIACKKLNRRFIGCDINQRYVDVSNRRLNNPWI